MDLAPFYLGLVKTLLFLAYGLCATSSCMFFLDMAIRGEVSKRAVGLQFVSMLLLVAMIAMMFVLCGLTFGTYVTGDKLEAARVMLIIVMLVTTLSIVGKIKTVDGLLTSSFFEFLQMGCVTYVFRLTLA
jgi:hypothetical protein